MFCPECAAEYRPGFTRCLDCDVDLVSELPEAHASPAKPKRDWASMFPTFKRAYSNGQKTVHWWTSYKRKTGAWPWSSIVIHVMNWPLVLLGIGMLIWWSGEHGLSRWKSVGIVLLVGLPYFVLESWAEKTVKLKLLRQAKGYSSSRQSLPRSR